MMQESNIDRQLSFDDPHEVAAHARIRAAVEAMRELLDSAPNKTGQVLRLYEYAREGGVIEREMALLDEQHRAALIDKMEMSELLDYRQYKAAEEEVEKLEQDVQNIFRSMSGDDLVAEVRKLSEARAACNDHIQRFEATQRQIEEASSCINAIDKRIAQLAQELEGMYSAVQHLLTAEEAYLRAEEGFRHASHGLEMSITRMELSQSNPPWRRSMSEKVDPEPASPELNQAKLSLPRVAISLSVDVSRQVAE